MNAMHESTNAGSRSLDRRHLLGSAGAAAVLASVLAACGQSPAGELGRVGNGAEVPELGPASIDDAVLLRTSASIERSIANVYARIAADGLLAAPSSTHPDLGDQTDLVTLLAQHHTDAAAEFDTLTTAAGGEPWSCGNPRLDAVFIDAILDRVLDGAAETDATAAIEPSDDVTRDVINLVHTLEMLSTATCQAMVPLVTQPSYRSVLMAAGVRSSRQAALVALTINPGGYLPGGEAAAPAESADSDTPPQTPIPLPVAAATQFGSLGAITYIGGLGDENGVRMKMNFETPSLNTLVYADLECAD
jgi:hypothetical protein